MIPLEKWGLSLLFVLAAASAHAQPARERTLELGGETLRYALRTHPPDAHLPDAAAAPDSALGTAKLVLRHLAAGKIEDVALLSNAPKARFERLHEALQGWNEEDFRRAYSRYLSPESRIVAEIAIEPHRMLIWRLADIDHLIGFFFVEVEGKFLLDDVPGERRSRLRRVLEAYRAGKIADWEIKP